jgi:hypothetical protein
MLYGKILFEGMIQGKTLGGEVWNGGWKFIKIHAVVFCIDTQQSDMFKPANLRNILLHLHWRQAVDCLKFWLSIYKPICCHDPGTHCIHLLNGSETSNMATASSSKPTEPNYAYNEQKGTIQTL